MEPGSSLFEEHERKSGRKNHSSLFEIKQVEFGDEDLLSSGYLALKQALFEINSDQTDDPIDFDGMEIPTIQAMLYGLLTSMHKVTIALDKKGVAIGIIVWQNVFSSEIGAIKYLWVAPEFRNLNVGTALIDSLGDVRFFLCQTLKVKPPLQMLRKLQNASVIFEDEKFLYWKARKI